MKKTIFGFATLMSAVVLAACGGGGTDTSGNNSGGNGNNKEELTFPIDHLQLKISKSNLFGLLYFHLLVSLISIYQILLYQI